MATMRAGTNGPSRESRSGRFDDANAPHRQSYRVGFLPESRRGEDLVERMRPERKIKSVEIIEVDEQFYFKVSDAAKYMGLSANTLRKYTDLGLIKAKRLPFSGDRRYRKDCLDEFMENLPDAVDRSTVSAYNHPQSDLSSNPRKEVR